MTRNCFQLCAVMILLMPGIFLGCIGGTSQKSVYYVFNPSQEKASELSPLKEKALGVGPIKLPGFLKRPHIVTRQESNVLAVNEFHRWGDSLEEQVSGVLVENFSLFLNSSNVTAYPWERSFAPAYQLFLDFRHFDGKINESITLETVWWLIDTDKEKRLVTKRSSIVVPTKKADYKSYVIALNDALEKLSHEITKEIANVLP